MSGFMVVGVDLAGVSHRATGMYFLRKMVAATAALVGRLNVQGKAEV